MVPFSVLIVNAMLGLFGTCMETRWVFFSLIPTIRARASLVLLDDAIATSFTMAAGFRDEEGTSLSCWLLNGSSSTPGWPASCGREREEEGRGSVGRRGEQEGLGRRGEQEGLGRRGEAVGEVGGRCGKVVKEGVVLNKNSQFTSKSGLV